MGAQVSSVTWSEPVDAGNPGTVTFTNPNSATTTATFSAPGSYVLKLTENTSGYGFYDLVAIRITDATYTGLIGYWPLDGSTSDASGNGNNGTALTTPDYVAGKVGQAMVFDGDVDGVEIPNVTFFDRVIKISPEMTVTFWAKMPYGERPHGHAISKALYDIANVQGAGWSLRADPLQVSGQLVAFVQRRATYHASKPYVQYIDRLWATAGRYDTLNDGRWHHYALTMYQDTYPTITNGYAFRLYVDGNSVGSAGYLDKEFQNITTNQPITLGFCKSFPGGLHWKGELDEVRIYDRPLSTGEIQALVDADGGTCTAIAGDVNGDCNVNIADFGLLAADWLDCTNYYPGDCFN
jgi:hypothetical protein